MWSAPKTEGYTGKFSPNSTLEQFDSMDMGDLSGPEAAVMDSNGDIIASSHEGWLVRFKPGSKEAQKWVDLKGRPLGLDIDQEGNIWVANAYLGLQRVTPDGEVMIATNKVENSLIQYADDVVVAPNGKLYFSDATTRFPAEQWGGTFPASVLDIVEHSKTGRVIEYDPESKQSKVVVEGLSFANGVTADPKGNFILINETGEYRVWKFWLDGDKAGQQEIIIDNLPGFPDNISVGQDGVFWVGIMAPRSKQLDDVADKPFLRKVMMRLPEAMRPQAKPYGMVIAINSRGEVVHNLQAPRGSLYTTTGVVETQSHLYVTSLTAPFLAKVSKADLGL